MIANNFSALWQAMAPKLADHLWQSTLFAAAAALLTLALRNHHPRVRYWLWLAASLKFLFPFSLLVALGSHLAPPVSTGTANAGLYVAMHQVSQPFTQTSLSISPVASSADSFTWMQLFPALVTFVWLCGIVMVLAVWCVRWRRVSAAIRQATPLREGREAEVLRRLERAAGMPKATPLLLSSSYLEPGVFGIAQPILLWPQGISGRLADAHLNAILAHELRHVRRRDNLAAAVHMLVEALFWFHPLVWWLGARLVEEREQACDQEVLELGNEPQVYAESILKVCEFCIESPLACVAGVTGADLKKRMANIMTARILRKLDFSRKLLLTTAALSALAAPIFFGLANPTPIRAQSQAQTAGAPAFEEVSINLSEPSGKRSMFNMMYTPTGFVADNVTLLSLILDAYGVQKSQIAGAPDWIASARFDVQAKSPQSVANRPIDHELSQDLPQHQMLRSLLADRFKLALHRETKNLPVYVLTVAQGGPKLHEAKASDTYPAGLKTLDGTPAGPGNMMMGRGMVNGQALPVADLAHLLSDQLGRPVLDKTGLTGKYDFALQWAPDNSQPPAFKDDTTGNGVPEPAASGPSIFAAIQQLGLKLEPQQSPMETLVIDHVEKPAEN